MFILVWVGLVMAVVIKPVLEILTPPEFHIAYRIARVEVFTVIMMGAGRHLMFGLAYAKDTAMISKLRRLRSHQNHSFLVFHLELGDLRGGLFRRGDGSGIQRPDLPFLPEEIPARPGL